MRAVRAAGEGRAAREAMQRLRRRLGEVVAGKDEAVELVMIAMIAGGHALIEDAPGMGKTTLAQALAASLDADFGRIQFTADLLPADVTGVEIFDPVEKRFVFHPGPIFHHVVLADEINRATPKAQSALLEAMAEGQVSIERATHPLPSPFLVLATQNPSEHLGVFPLPESQLDRFFCRFSLGYPDAEAERRILAGRAGRDILADAAPVAEVADWQAARAAARAMPTPEPLLDYVLTLLAATREGGALEQGASPRAGRDLMAGARARAWLHGEPWPTAADVRALWIPCLAHRVRAEGDAALALADILERTPVPA